MVDEVTRSNKSGNLRFFSGGQMYIEPTSKRITITRREEMLLREILAEFVDLKTSQTTPDDRGASLVSFAETLSFELEDKGK